MALQGKYPTGGKDGVSSLTATAGLKKPQPRGEVRDAVGGSRLPHSRYVTISLAKVAVPRDFFRKIPSLVSGLRPRPIPTHPDNLADRAEEEA